MKNPKILLGHYPGYCDACGRWRGKLTILREDFCGARLVYGEYWCDDCLNKFEEYDRQWKY